eukprot:snap_masked-scaffold_89-processed-gene-0.14-mRNA-1 protein AED:1.00 eAED:1.00 QI:0/0/0/0/1/1/3/0/141
MDFRSICYILCKKICKLIRKDALLSDEIKQYLQNETRGSYRYTIEIKKLGIKYSVQDYKDKKSYIVRILNGNNKTSFQLVRVRLGPIFVFHADTLAELVSRNIGLFMKGDFFFQDVDMKSILSMKLLYKILEEFLFQSPTL